jgi:hypothetical protein
MKERCDTRSGPNVEEGDLSHAASGPLDVAAAYAGDRLVSTYMPGMKKFCSTWSV